ncbi:MAG: FAD-binding oxidoreductase [Negativicutes bacterium]|nr:FAD-binding oxidoreductase [Negativicutes bacterium]
MAEYNPVTPEIISRLTQIIGPKNITTDPEKLEQYSHDEESDTQYHKMPEVVLFPENTEQVAEIMKVADQELIPVVARGAGTGLACAAVPIYGGIVLSFEKMNRILEVNAENMYMIVEPGVRTDDIQAAAAKAGLFYAGDPCSGDSCFIGGNVATNAGGNRAVKYGTTRDQVYAIKMVTAQGEIVDLGGRLAKNSTGYNLEQLIIGSEGTLGLITEITLKLAPQPQEVIDLLGIFPDVDSAIGIVPKLIRAGITPTSVEFMDNDTVKSVEHFLNEKLPHSERGHYVIIQVEGINETDLEDKSVFIDELCNSNGAIEVLVGDPAKVWKWRKAYLEASRHESLIMAKEDLVVPVDHIPAVMRVVTALNAKYGVQTRVASHAGDGNVHLNILKGKTPDAEWEQTLYDYQHELYKAVYKMGGKLSGEHGIGLKRKKLMHEFTHPVELKMMQAIKKALDPKLLLNPGKIFDVK